MLAEISEVSMTQADGGSPTMLGASSAPGESGVFVVRGSWKDGVHVNATARSHHVFFNLSGQSRFLCRIADRSLFHRPQRGSLTICPAGSDYAADADRSAQMIFLAIEPGRLALAAAEDLALEARLIDRLSGSDQTLLDLAHSLASESAAAHPNGPVYWNGVASAFIDGLLARHMAKFERRAIGTLSKDVFLRVRDYVEAHLDEPIEVGELANIAGRSPFHFTRVFTQAVGMSPHRYIVRMRLERAVALMLTRRSGLAEIAACTGFADQSHLSRWVRRVYGASPSQLAA
jgi:AraC family transcriptional regulator